MVLSFNLTLIPPCVDFNSPGDYFLFLFHLLAGLSTVLVAGSVACGIAATRSLLRQNRFLFMLNTSICDTMTGCSIFYQFLLDVRLDFPSKHDVYFIVPSLLGVNFMTFLFAQFERYFAVCHPFFYGRFIGTKLVVCVNIFSWLYVYGKLFVQHLVPLSTAIQIGIYGRVGFGIMVATKLVMTVKLFIVAKFQLLREPPGPERDSKKESLLIIIVVVVFFFVLWFPSLFYTLISAVTKTSVSFRNDAVNPMKILTRSNALCTPSLYLWASPSLRAAVWKKIWSKVCCCCTEQRRLRIVSWKKEKAVEK